MLKYGPDWPDVYEVLGQLSSYTFRGGAFVACLKSKLSMTAPLFSLSRNPAKKEVVAAAKGPNHTN